MNFFWTKKHADDEQQQKLTAFGLKLQEVTQELKQIKEDLEKLEIKALESRKIYHKKLKKEFGDEEEKKEDKYMNGVILPER